MKYAYGIAAFGFLASLVVHVCALAGIALQEKSPAVLGLHLGIFAVVVPIMLVYSRNNGRKLLWNHVIRHVPGWIKSLVGALMLYAFFNFFFTLFVLNEGASASVIDGKKVLHNHGKVIRELSEDEYGKHKAYDARLFSGHWLLIYSVAAVLAYARIMEKALPSGDDASVVDNG
jgi:hypothetical protein